MSLLHWAGIALALLLAVAFFLLLQVVHFSLVLKWADWRTNGLRYYGLSKRRRNVFRGLLNVHRRLLSPLLTLLRWTTTFRLASGTFHFRGVAAPKGGACSGESFERAVKYAPRAEDVFVVTQMRCGTTWMQHLVLQVLTRGRRDLPREDVTLNAISPWLESHKTVGVDEAPLVGDGPSARRIIKTHLPASLCPLSTDAKYIYVARHPVSCFASCVDFVRGNLGGFPPDMEDFFHWYTSSDGMWFSTWFDHADSWWLAAEQSTPVLFVRFEDMKQDIASVADRIARFLDLPPLSDEELDGIRTKCSFEFMRRHATVFEMHAPHLLQVPERSFVSGKVDRYCDVSPEVRHRILDWCRREQYGRSFPIEQFYPELGDFFASPAASEPATLGA